MRTSLGLAQDKQVKKDVLIRFESYLRDVKGFLAGTIRNRLSDCDRLARHEGDLDAHFDKDGMEDLLARLTYSTGDQRRDLPPKHCVPINGDIRTGTATLKSAAKLYRSFREYDGKPIDRQSKPTMVRRSRRARAPAMSWPEWRQPEEADLLKLAHVLTPLVKFLHPDIVAAVAEDNQCHLADWRPKLEEVGIDADIYLWTGSPCAFPGVRRYAGSQEIAWYRKRTASTDFTPPHCIRLDDNDCPKHLWSFVFTGGPFRKKGPREYQLAHLADHKEHNNRWREEFSTEFQADPPLLFGLYTSPANTAYVPRNFLQPTDVVHPLRALLLKQAYRLYGRVCRLAPPPLAEKALDAAAWNPNAFSWGDPVGDSTNLARFLEYRQEEFNRALETRLVQAKGARTRVYQEEAKTADEVEQEPVETPSDGGERPAFALEERAQVAATQSETAWAEARELVAEPLHAAMRHWASAGLPAPVVGFELANDGDEVLAEAELAWPTQRIVVLHEEQVEKVSLFERRGWHAYSFDESTVERITNDLRSSRPDGLPTHP